MTTTARSLLRSALTPSATLRSASMSRPESVSSRMQSFGSSTPTFKQDLAVGPHIGIRAGQPAGQRALAGAILAHDGVNLTGLNLEVDAAEDFFVVDLCVKIEDG